MVNRRDFLVGAASSLTALSVGRSGTCGKTTSSCSPAAPPCSNRAHPIASALWAEFEGREAAGGAGSDAGRVTRPEPLPSSPRPARSRHGHARVHPRQVTVQIRARNGRPLSDRRSVAGSRAHDLRGPKAHRSRYSTLRPLQGVKNKPRLGRTSMGIRRRASCSKRAVITVITVITCAHSTGSISMYKKDLLDGRRRRQKRAPASRIGRMFDG